MIFEHIRRSCFIAKTWHYIPEKVVRKEVFPFEPLEKALRKSVWSDKTGRGNNAGGLTPVLPNHLLQAYYRFKRKGYVTMTRCEDFADFLGLHPCEIWDNWFQDAA